MGIVHDDNVVSNLRLGQRCSVMDWLAGTETSHYDNNGCSLMDCMAGIETSHYGYAMVDNQLTELEI